MSEAANTRADVVIEEWQPDRAGAAAVDQDIDMLGEVLHAVVHAGAGVSFFVPFSLDDARGFWRDKVLPGVRVGTRRVLVAHLGGRIVGTVQLDLAVPPNQRHRAEITKMLVHPTARRRGIGRALMQALEPIAMSEQRTLLTLDTVTGSAAEPLYLSLGYIAVGVIPRYARGSLTPELEAATIMYKELSQSDDQQNARQPPALDAILADTAALGFGMASEPRVGAFLSALAASKPAGRVLELGTGTGHGTAWLLAGMDAAARLVTVDTDPDAVAVARRHLGSDNRVTFHVMDGAEYLGKASPGQFDLIYADAWPGKFTHLDRALALLRIGGIYCVDDLLPQPNWPEGHAPKVATLIEALEARTGFVTARLAWASGLMLVTRTAPP
jgi:predicted O-methyltransferase YrrM/GNAT superfamily N-acetyltransferase